MRFHYNKKLSLLSAFTEGGRSQKIICKNQKVFVYFYGDVRTLPNGKVSFKNSAAAVFRFRTPNNNVSKVSFIKLV
jgi:hypothetical protein